MLLELTFVKVTMLSIIELQNKFQRNNVTVKSQKIVKKL